MAIVPDPKKCECPLTDEWGPLPCYCKKEEAKPKPLPFKEIDEVFTCDCGSQACGCLVATLIDEHMAILEMADESLLNIPVHWRLWRSLKIFWEAFWNHSHRIEIVLNRKQNKQFKAFFATLKDERCHECDPDYLEGKGKYYTHGH